LKAVKKSLKENLFNLKLYKSRKMMEQKSSNSMKETKMGNQGSSFISDPLFYGKVNMDTSEKAQLHSGDKVCHSFMQNTTSH
jgi:isopentenyl phosphate kinase